MHILRVPKRPPQRPPKLFSMLGRFLGSEKAAAQFRLQRERREAREGTRR